jgi:hypothetical protein
MRTQTGRRAGSLPLVLAMLLLASAALFAVGVAVERSSTDPHRSTEPAGAPATPSATAESGASGEAGDRHAQGEPARRPGHPRGRSGGRLLVAGCALGGRAKAGGVGSGAAVVRAAVSARLGAGGRNSASRGGVATGLAAPGVDAFADGDAGDSQRGQRVGPGPAGGGV